MLGEVVSELYRVGIIKFGEFTLASGKKSPYYFDFRVLPSYPRLYSKVIELWISRLNELNMPIECIVGIASAGIVHAAILGYLMKKPIGYVRAERKDHGTSKLVEGLINGKVLMVDDVATTGGTLRRAYNAIKDVGAEVIAFTVILDREEGAESVSRELNIKFVPLMSASQVFKLLRDNSLISDGIYNEVIKYLKGGLM